MTLDETINNFAEVAKNHRYEQQYWLNERDETSPLYEADRFSLADDSRESAEYYEQLAEWLTDYKELKNTVGAWNLSTMKEALDLIKTLKADLNGWRYNPFDIIAEVCGAVTDCRRCQWYEKCPKNYGSYPSEWRAENDD